MKRRATMLSAMLIAAATLAISCSSAVAQSSEGGRVCGTPTALDYTPAEAARRFQQGQNITDPVKKWRDTFMAAVRKCQQGDILVIEREVLPLTARLCDLDKPIVFRTGHDEAALCTYVGHERENR